MITIKTITKENFSLEIRTNGEDYRVEKIHDNGTTMPISFCGEYVMSRLDAKHLVELYND
jgi:hypothetical protein